MYYEKYKYKNMNIHNGVVHTFSDHKIAKMHHPVHKINFIYTWGQQNHSVN